MKTAIKYLMSFVIAVGLCQLVFIPGLESSNELIKTATLILFIFTIIWSVFIFPKNK